MEKCCSENIVDILLWKNDEDEEMCIYKKINKIIIY